MDTPPVAPPLPWLFDAARQNDSVSASEWRRFVESVPVYSERLVISATNQASVGTRSPFRSGTMRFDTDGITIEGMARQLPPRWFSFVATFSALPYLLGQFFYAFARRSGMPRSARLLFVFVPFLFMLVPALLRGWVDKRRVPTKMLLGWESVRGLRVDPKLRHVTLVYEPFDTPPKPRVLRLFRKPAAVSTPHVTPLLSCNFLTLNRLEPAVVAGIVETVEHFAPSVKREPLPGQNALRWLSIVLLTIAGVVLFVVLLAAYFRIRRLGRP